MLSRSIYSKRLEVTFHAMSVEVHKLVLYIKDCNISFQLLYTGVAVAETPTYHTQKTKFIANIRNLGKFSRNTT